MKLVPNAGRIAARSHSMWANYLGILSLIMPDLIYLLSGEDTNPHFWFWLGLGLIVYGIFGRLIDQGIASGVRQERNKMRSPVMVTLAAFLMVAVPYVAEKEGKSNLAYLDQIASPPVWTVCFGETRGVKAGDYYTDDECRAMLAQGLTQYRSALHVYFSPTTIATRLTPQRETAYVSLAWNVGITGAGRSTAVRRLNAGDIKGGCEAITWWNKAGQRIVRGLVIRRADDFRLCMVGIT